MADVSVLGSGLLTLFGVVVGSLGTWFVAWRQGVRDDAREDKRAAEARVAARRQDQRDQVMAFSGPASRAGGLAKSMQELRTREASTERFAGPVPMGELEAFKAWRTDMWADMITEVSTLRERLPQIRILVPLVEDEAADWLDACEDLLIDDWRTKGAAFSEARDAFEAAARELLNN